VSRRLLAAAALLLALGGCGAGGGPLELVSSEPPAGAEAAGKRAERQGGNDPDAGERIFKLRPIEGDPLTYTVAVRNPTSEVVSVTGVAADEDRDGAFVPERIENGPVQVKPGATAPVTVEGTVHGCRYGGQMVPLAGPELELRTDGGTSTQEFDLGIQVQLVVQGCS
jgi:predicted small lipoprotein YifL